MPELKMIGWPYREPTSYYTQDICMHLGFPREDGAVRTLCGIFVNYPDVYDVTGASWICGRCEKSANKRGFPLPPVKK